MKKAYSASPVCIQEMLQIIAGGALIELFVPLVPITLMRFVVFPHHTEWLAEALRQWNKCVRPRSLRRKGGQSR